ncbi:MAG TPA: type II toxin-antitoxin system RatA family toxin [Caulobacteraceae bacterium]|nr:type II toxin-antitoxin system RatA family toxin [Caulobacteraceae bacterium]
MRHSLTRILPYQPRQLFDLVGDVERYPEFVPWVTRLTTANCRPDGDGITRLDATADVGFSIVRERFATSVRLDEPALAIDVDLISGPFRRLHNRWRFKAHPRGAELGFEIDFEFKSRVLTALLSANFHYAVNRLVGCFEDRARALYGKPK